MFPNEVLNFCKEYFGENALSIKEWGDFHTSLIAKHDTRFADEVSVLYFLMEMNRRGFAISIGSAMKLIDVCEDELRNVIDGFLYSMISSYIMANYPSEIIVKLDTKHKNHLKKGNIVHIDSVSGNMISEKIKDLKEKGY